MVPFLSVGRLAYITDWGWGIVVNFTKKRIDVSKAQSHTKLRERQELLGMKPGEETSNHYVVDMLLYVSNRVTPDNHV